MVMAKTVKRYVHVENPDTLETVVLQPGMKVPDWAKDIVTNPKVFEDDPNTEAPVNEAPVVSVEDGQQGVDGSEVTVGPTEPVDPGPVNETPNANPVQRPTADEPGGNQAPDAETPAPADDPANPASTVVDPAAAAAAAADQSGTAKKAASGRTTKKAASSRTTKKAAAKKSAPRS